jgi:hypothetical protein
MGGDTKQDPQQEDRIGQLLESLVDAAVHEDRNQDTFFKLLGSHNSLLTEVDAQGSTLCHKLVKAGKYRAIKLLGSRGFEISAVTPDSVGMTPLMYACELNAHKTIQHLIGHMSETGQICSTMELIAVASCFPESLVEYLGQVEFLKATAERGEALSFRNRYPMSNNKGQIGAFVVAGSANKSAEGLWERHREKTIAQRKRPCLQKFISALFSCRAFYHPAEYNSSVEDINVKAKVVPFDSIVGPVNDINDTALWALTQSGCDDLMTTDTLKAMLDYKWMTFAGGQHRNNIFQFIGLIFSQVLYAPIFRRGKFDERFDSREMQRDSTYYVLLYIMCSFNTCFFLVQDIAAVITMGLGRFTGPAAAWNSLSFLTYFMTSAMLILHWFNWEHTQAIAAGANFLAWISIIGFLRCFPGPGPFISMISAIISDMTYFAILFILMILAFSSCFLMLMPEEGWLAAAYGLPWSGRTSFFTTEQNAFHHTFLMSVGDFGDALSTALALSPYPAIVEVVFILFTLLVPIILLNLLIAIMGDTYETVKSDGVEDDWRMSQATVILEIEAKFCGWDNPLRYPRWLHVLVPKGPKVKTEEQEKELMWHSRFEELRDAAKEEVEAVLQAYFEKGKPLPATG